MSQRRAWQQWELDVLRTQYAHTPTQKLSRSIGRSESAVYGRAAILGLKKSETYLAGPDACRLRRCDNVGASCRFLPGHVPANKGLRRPGFAPGRMAQTQFKPGARPHTWKPIGSTRLSKDGYVQRKVSDTGYPPRDWVGEHILIWQQAHGPVPKGFAVAFRDGNKAHLDLDNFELISRRELMRRNTIHNYPPELAEVIRLGASLKRQIRKIDEEQNHRPSQPSV
jgi:HNH endonuclease